MDSLSIQFNLLYATLLRAFGDRVELVYIDASTLPGREELSALKAGDGMELPVLANGDRVLFSGRIPVAELLRYVRGIVERRRA